MNTHNFLVLATAILLLLAGRVAAAGPQDQSARSSIAVTDLRCEYLRNPLGIDTVMPRFSWKLTAAEHLRAQSQSAYQVVVESDNVDASTNTCLWDSGKVSSNQSVNVEYAGRPLTSGQSCRWMVRIWDQDGAVTDWSPRATFSMGLLVPSDWKGQWIGYRDPANFKHFWFRRKFALKAVPARATAYLCSIGYHEVYVNGERIGDSVLAPSVTNLEKRALYLTYDITGHLKQGDNVIAVWTGPGWARADGSFGKGVWEQDPIFRCQVNFSDGTSIHTDRTWRCQVSSSENLGLWKGGGQGEYGGELIDARRNISDWNLASCDDRQWPRASVYEKSLILSAAMLEPDRKVETLKPVSMQEQGGLYTFDMGRNFTGWLEFKLRNGKEGELVRFFTANQPGKMVDFKQESHYIHDASGNGTFSHRFNYMAGRWITVQGLTYQPEIEDLTCYVITNDRRRTGSFDCSLPLFNQIYEIDLRTYIANTVNGVTMDCPHRERYGYGEVALACTWGCAIPHFESEAYYTKVARDWYDVQREDGFVNTIAPQVYKGAGGTLWSSAPVTMTWEFYRAYGDKRLLQQGYPSMKRWVDYLHEHVDAKGVLTAYESPSRFLGDWATPHGSEYGNTPPAELFNNCVYAYCLQVMIQSAQELGNSDDAKTYSSRLRDLRNNVHRRFFRSEPGHYIDGRQLSMVFPLFTGVTPEAERDGVFQKFAEEITNRKPYLDTGSSGLPILLKFIVEDAQRPDLLFAPLTRTEYPGYGYFIGQGETTWPEYWRSDIDSRIHTCYTGISGYFTKAIGGIRPHPSRHGMQEFIIKPFLTGDLTYARTTCGSGYGPITSNWSRDGAVATFELQIPPNTTATVYIPSRKDERVLEGKAPAGQAKGVRHLRRDGSHEVFEVQSGTYKFSSTLP